MSLSDIMGHMDLSVYPQIGLVIFLAVFAMVVSRLLGRRTGEASRAHAMIPLDDGPAPVRRPGAARENEEVAS